MNTVSINGSSIINGFVGDISDVSSDTLLTYCQSQLDTIDGQIAGQVNQQNAQLQERSAIEQVQTTLESFGTQGPTNGADMAECVAAFQQAIASLPAGDPVAAQLQTQCQTMISTYGYQAGSDKLANPPKNDDWQGTTDALSNLDQNVKSDSDIEMLSLQDLVSQREQAVQLATSIMGKVDDTLESQAKAIGQ